MLHCSLLPDAEWRSCSKPAEMRLDVKACRLMLGALDPLEGGTLLPPGCAVLPGALQPELTLVQEKMSLHTSPCTPPPTTTTFCFYNLAFPTHPSAFSSPFSDPPPPSSKVLINSQSPWRC